MTGPPFVLMRYPSVSAGPEVTVVTAAALLSQAISADYTKQQISSGLSGWKRPTVIHLSAFLTELWQSQRYRSDQIPALLSSTQELAIWERLFRAELPNLFDHAAAARLAMDAARTVAEWNLPRDSESWGEYTDAAHFRKVGSRFRIECQSRNVITQADLWRLAPAWLASGSLAGETKPVVFAGFEAISPGLRQLSQAFRSGSTFAAARDTGSKSAPQAYAFASLEDEALHVARWARAKLESDPSASIGILAADLGSNRTLLKDAFDAVFYPEPWHNGTQGNRDSVRIQGADPLLQEPAIAGGLLLLELAAERALSVNDASALLRSAYLPGADEERSHRALADLYLRQKRENHKTLAQIGQATQQCPGLQQTLRKLEQAHPPRMASLSEWSSWMGKVLERAGWPGSAQLSFRERATLESWDAALTQLSALGFVSSPVAWAQALTQLKSVLQTVNAPELGTPMSPVQILDADAAAGLQFDFAALVNFSEGTWPRLERSQPFLPVRLRKMAGMPGATAQSAAELRRRRAAVLVQSAPKLIVTYCQALSPWLVDHVAKSRRELSGWSGLLAEQAFTPLELERLVDEQGPPLAAAAASGGVGILKSQSACPFQAFAKYRLQAEAPEEAVFGLDARERGGTVHRALEHAWRRLGNSDQLQQTSSAELLAIAQEAAAVAINAEASNPFAQTVADAERVRLTALLQEWLQLEKTRLQPFAAEHVEEKRAVTIGGLTLQVRIDRIDRLSDGSVLLLDYKTGTPSIQQLTGERPEEPQLLTYAAGLDADVAGVYFAQVRSREMKAQGLAASPHFPVNTRSRAKAGSSWAEVKAKSVETLSAIAAEFTAGLAAVSPRAGSCTFCGFEPLCRINEGESAQEDDAGE